MRQRHRQRSWTFFAFMGLLLTVCLVSCGHTNKQRVLKAQRHAMVDYETITISKEMPAWVNEFYLRQAQNKLEDKNFWWRKSDANTQEFVIDSGARVEQEVACPVVRAQAREVIAEKLTQRLMSKVKGKTYDTVVMGKGFGLMMNELKGLLDQKAIAGQFEEGRSFPATAKLKGQEVYHCALLIRVSTASLNLIVEQIKQMIKEDFFHLPNLESELEELGLP